MHHYSSLRIGAAIPNGNCSVANDAAHWRSRPSRSAHLQALEGVVDEVSHLGRCELTLWVGHHDAHHSPQYTGDAVVGVLLVVPAVERLFGWAACIVE